MSSTSPVPYPSYCSPKTLSDIFDSFDIDHDGRLSRDELRVCLALSGKPVSDSQLDMLVALADPDDDGKIHRQDFIDFHQNPQKAFERIRLDRSAPTTRESGFLPALTAEKLSRMNPATRRAKMTDVVHALLGVSEIRPRDVKVLYKRFKELDTKKIGKLNLLQFSRLFEGSENSSAGFKNEKARISFVNLLFNFCDRDKSGSVDTKEFITSLCYMATMGEVERLRFSFMLFDIDGDGYMDRQELIQLVSSIHLGLSESELGDLVNKVDSILRIYASEGAGGSSARMKWKETKLTFDKLIKVSADNPGLFNAFDDS